LNDRRILFIFRENQHPSSAGKNPGTQKAIQKKAHISSIRQLHNRRQPIILPNHPYEMSFSSRILKLNYVPGTEEKIHPKRAETKNYTL